MNLIEIFKNFEKKDIFEIIKQKDPLTKKRKEYKFLVRKELLQEIATKFVYDYYCCVHSGTFLFEYENIYFDTDDFIFFNKHRVGKPNRLKVRIRKYKSGDKKSFLEIKRKVKGVFSEKERILIEETSEKNDEKIIEKASEKLKSLNISFSKLSRKLTTNYSRIFLISKDNKRRITFDIDLKAKDTENNEKKLFSQYGILEIKDENTPKDIMQFLMKNFKIRKTGFSKYCISLCALSPNQKNNKWKQILKLNKEDI